MTANGGDADHAEQDGPRDDIDRTGPLGDLAATVVDGEGGTDGRTADRDAAERDDPTGDPDDALGEFFDREDVADVDRERLWERLEGETETDSDAGDGDANRRSSDDARTGDVVRGDEREIREIDKGSYCHQCEHFAEPPTVACTREGTAILELPSVETFRVADCPVVLTDEALEEGGRERP